ncbi:MAG: hypothetical protein RL038_65 [Actinomycetota bacterium]
MSFSVRTSFGFFNVEFNPERVGVDSLGNKTAGGVSALRIGAEADYPVSKNQYADLLLAWSSGDYSALNDIPVIYPDSQFRLEVSVAMRSIPAGAAFSYAELAAAAGNPNAVRAAASVCARNPIPIIIPCHRVIKSDGSIGNYFYGSALKDQLLRHENFQFST